MTATAFENLLAFEVALMDWVSLVSVHELCACDDGRELLKARRRMNELLNEIVADSREMRRLEGAYAAPLHALVASLSALPKRFDALTDVLRVVHSFSSLIAPPKSGEHRLGLSAKTG